MITSLLNSGTDYSVTKFNSEAGFPHSEIVGSKFAHNSPTLIAACHVLHRLCMPRHPPIALTSRLRIHTTIDNTACMTGANISVVWFCCYGLGSAPIRNSQLDNQLFVTDTIVPTRQSARKQTAWWLEPSQITASISRTHSQCQRGAKRPTSTPANRRETGDLHLWKIGELHA